MVPHARRGYGLVLAVLPIVFLLSCSPASRNPASPSPGAAASRAPAVLAGGAAQAGSAASAVPQGIIFPPRNEPFAFRAALETKYRNDLGRPATPTFVDMEGDIVWTSEYLRYRLSTCSHDEATNRVFMQIDGLGVQPDCGAAASTAGIWSFPPRNEPYDFRLRLERKYQGMDRQPQDSFVDLEGDIVWTVDYHYWRVNGCTHDQAVQRVFAQIDGQGPQQPCAFTYSPIYRGRTNQRGAVLLQTDLSIGSRRPIVSGYGLVVAFTFDDGRTAALVIQGAGAFFIAADGTFAVNVSDLVMNGTINGDGTALGTFRATTTYDGKTYTVSGTWTATPSAT